MTRLLLILCLALGVVIFGGTPHWVRVALIGLVLVMTLGTGIVQWGQRGVAVARTELVAALLFLLAWAWGMAGSLDGSAPWFDWMNGPAATPAAQVAAQLDLPPPDTLALLPVRAAEQAIWIGALGLLFCVALFAARRTEKLGVQLFYATHAILGGAALYGVSMSSTGVEQVLWHDKTAYQGLLTGTFINPNHFSTLMVIGFMGALGLVIADMQQRHRIARLRRASVAIRSRVRYLIETTPLRLIGIGLCALYAGAIYLAGSQGGIGTLGLASGLTVGIVMFQQGRMILALGALAGTAIVAWIGYQLLFGAGDAAAIGVDLSSLYSRTVLFSTTLAIIESQPILGTGLGSFQDMFRQAKPDWVLIAVDYAHNVYLELALELGVPMTLVLLASPLILLLRLIYLGHRSRMQNYVFRPLQIMAIGATLAVAIHGVVDFSVQIPGVAVTWLVILGLAVGQVQPNTDALG
ncbi:MAG: O-antigen ligase family protein [Alphaproteobacteria bacterium]